MKYFLWRLVYGIQITDLSFGFETLKSKFDCIAKNFFQFFHYLRIFDQNQKKLSLFCALYKEIDEQ